MRKYCQVTLINISIIRLYVFPFLNCLNLTNFMKIILVYNSLEKKIVYFDIFLSLQTNFIQKQMFISKKREQRH